jgi:hypothetical protein
MTGAGAWIQTATTSSAESTEVLPLHFTRDRLYNTALGLFGDTALPVWTAVLLVVGNALGKRGLSVCLLHSWPDHSPISCLRSERRSVPASTCCLECTTCACLHLHYFEVMQILPGG